VSSSGSGTSLARASRPQSRCLMLVAPNSYLLCWAGVTLYFFRRYTLSVWIALAAVVILLVYKLL